MQSDCDYVNFTPSAGSDLPALEELALNVTVPETANSVPEVSEIWPKIGTATFGVADPCKCKEEKNESLFVMVSRKSPEVLGLKLESPG